MGTFLKVINMDNFVKILLQTQERLLANVPKDKRLFSEQLGKELSKKRPLAIMVSGLRGTGKTVSLLQNLPQDGFYFRADNIGFRKHSLQDVVEYAYSELGKTSYFIDEVHTYPNWQDEIKGLYDDYPDISLVMSGSSSIRLVDSSADLSRRLKILAAEPLFFHEFLELKFHSKPPLFLLEQILEEPLNVALEIEKKYPAVHSLFHEYMRVGGFPIFFHDKDVIPLLMNGIDAILQTDLGYVAPSLTQKISLKARPILLFLASSRPGEFSYDTVASATELSKGSVYQLMDALVRSNLICFLGPQSPKSIIKLRKKSKVYFSHPTLRNVLLQSAGEEENIGSMREEIFFHHVKNVVDSVGYPIGEGPKEPDFQVISGAKKYLFEIGKHHDGKGFINIVDSKDSGLPLYLFGFIKKEAKSIE